MRIFIGCLFTLLSVPPCFAQHTPDWDNYVMYVNQKPVSIVVDLGLKAQVPLRDHPYVVIVRTKLLKAEANGQPGKEERATLDRMENRLDSALEASSGAIYAGRFTQRGLREFYFYTIDSVGFLKGVESAMSQFPEYQFLCQAKADLQWEHYLQVLYPPEKEYEGILSRRQVDELANRGDRLRSPRRIDHHLAFATRSGRDAFLRDANTRGFQSAGLEDGPESENMRFFLHIYRNDTPGYIFVDQVVLPLWEAARAQKGQYRGWETVVAR